MSWEKSILKGVAAFAIKHPKTAFTVSAAGKIASKGAHAAKGIASFAEKHPKTALAATAVALPKLGHKEGLLNFAKDKILGESEQKKGIAHVAGDLLLGEDKDAQGNEKSIIEKTLDTAFGDGTYSKFKNAGGAVIDEGANAYGHLKNGASYLGNEVGSLFTGNGMVDNGNGSYYDPTSTQYPSMAQMTGQQGGGITGSLMNGMNSAVSSISGGNVSKMNLAGLMLSAYMMFGRFGWLGKAASLMLGGMTLNSINNHRQPQMQTQSQLPQLQMQPAVQQLPYPAPEHHGTGEDVVVRSRHL